MEVPYVIITWSDVYHPWWIVVRMTDKRVVARGSVWDCLHWVKSWGQTDFAKAKRGEALSSRVLDRI